MNLYVVDKNNIPDLAAVVSSWLKPKQLFLSFHVLSLFSTPMGKFIALLRLKKVKATAIYFELRQLWLGSVISQERKFIWVQIKMFMIPGQFN